MLVSERKDTDMKKTIAIGMICILLLSVLGCSAAKKDDTAVRIAGMTGPTSMGLVKLMEDRKEDETYVFSIFGSADEVTPKLVKGELDIAAVPANLASVLYNNTEGEIRLLAVNTLGVLYIVEKGNSISSIADLKGKTVYATGKGSTPEYTLRYILEKNGIDPDKDLTLEFKSEPAEVVSVLAGEQEAVAMLPQPYVTVAMGKVEGLHIAVDLTEAWEKLDNGSTLVTGTFVVRKEFLDAHPEKVKEFLDGYGDSVEWVLSNAQEAAPLMEKAGIVKADVAEKALPYCNLVFLAGEDMKEPVEGYLTVLFEQNPKAIGGQLPGDDFYCIMK